MRDSQRSKVYAWEAVAYPTYRTDRILTPRAAFDLVHRVHADVIKAGGHAAHNVEVKFTKRNGGCGSWGKLNFSKKFLPIRHVLHEIAHSLTLGFAAPGSDYAAHRDHQGHGSRFVACMIALIEKYAGDDAAYPLAKARLFKMEVMGPWRLTSTPSADGSGRTFFHKTRVPVERYASINVDGRELTYWRTLLGKV